MSFSDTEPLTDPLSALVRRHDGHKHFANMKYGYIVFLLSFVFVSLISVKSAFFKRQSAKYNSKLLLCLAVCFWTLFIWFFCVVNVEFELKPLAKRAGRITYALFPVVMFLSFRPSPLPGVSYIEALELHKWISRVIVLSALFHSFGYFVHFVRSHRLDKLFRLNNFLGLLSMISMIIMAILSLKPVRRRIYKLFHYLHYPLAWLITIFIIFHARPGVLVMAFWTIAILLAQIVYRVFTQVSIGNLQVTQLSSTLKLVTLPRYCMPAVFPMGSHLRVSVPITSLKAWLNPTHPYSIASISSDSEVRLLIRECSFPIEAGINVSVTGPYCGPDSEVYTDADEVLIIAGGSGLSFGASVYRGLDQKGVNVSLVWIIRNRSEVAALELLEIEKADVYVTNTLVGDGRKGIGSRFRGQSGDQLEGDEVEMSDLLAAEEDIDLFDEFEQEMDETLKQSDKPISKRVENQANGSSASTIPLRQDSNSTLANETNHDELRSRPPPSKGIRVHTGRPDLSGVAGRYFGNSIGLKKWVIACGPEELVDSARQVADATRNVMFYGEKYVM